MSGVTGGKPGISRVQKRDALRHFRKAIAAYSQACNALADVEQVFGDLVNISINDLEEAAGLFGDCAESDWMHKDEAVTQQLLRILPAEAKATWWGCSDAE